MEEKISKLSKTIVEYSLNLNGKDKVLIGAGIEAKPLVLKLVEDIVSVGAIVDVDFVDSEISSLLSETASNTKIESMYLKKQYEVDNYTAFIHIRVNDNDYNSKNISGEKRGDIGRKLEPLLNIRTNERKWVLLNYPTNIDAYKASMTTKDFMDYAFDVMCVDYKSMNDKVRPLKELMDKTDKVRIVSKDTDISFSIKDIPAIPCCGTCNIPDGEIYTAPVKDSINGTITFNTPCPYHGNIYTNVSLTYKDGLLVKSTCNEDDELLSKIFDIDDGARHVGEFAIGINPLITTPMGDILFDEKIIGSIHFTPGSAYKDAYNGNDSAIHWDMVLILTDKYNGGEIYFDDLLISKNGKFILEKLKCLNN